uniref:Post-SET domain-containing protein n=1 Tax=Steinernema glaseri TaxID=37863 RepID=A0A1I7ZK57_9BILA
CDGTTRLALFSIQKIKAGQELTFQYGMETITDGVGPLPDCYCGTKECTGVLGYRKEEKSKPKTSKSTTRGRPSLNKKNKPPTLPSSTNILLKEHNSGSCGGRGVGRKRKWTELPPSRENAGLSPATVAESTECPVREGLPIEELQSPI